MIMNEFYNFLTSIEGISLRTPTAAELTKLKKIASNKLPDLFTETYTDKMPMEDVEFLDFVFYDINRIYDENTDYVPGANLLPYGLFTFASTFDGDSICIDMNEPHAPVYQCSHSLFDDETSISYYKGEIISLEFNYENIIRLSPKLAGSFLEFIRKLSNKDIITYSVTDIINML